MGKLLDMLPQIEAEARTRDILEYLGCVRLDCTVEIQDDVVRLGRWVRHNDETKFFEHVIERFPVPVQIDVREPPVAYIPSDIAAWFTSHHSAIEERREQERQAVVDADPWLQHAAMTSLSWLSAGQGTEGCSL